MPEDHEPKSKSPSEDDEKNRKAPWLPAELHPHDDPPPSEPTIRLNTEELRRAEELRQAEELRRAGQSAPPAEPTRRITYAETLPSRPTPPPAEPSQRPTPPPPEAAPRVPLPGPPTEPTRRIAVPPPDDATHRVTPPPHGAAPPLPHGATQYLPPQSPYDAPPAQPARTRANAPTHYAPPRSYSPPPAPARPRPVAAPSPPVAANAAPPAPTTRWASILLTVTLIAVGIFFLGLMAAVVGYITIAAQLPSPDELRARQPNFASSQLYDRDGKLLHEIIDPSAGKRTYTPISQIAKDLQYATVATEDRNFYVHSGFDPIAIARAVYYALQEKEIVSGASTITQQVARNILLPDEATEVSANRKIKEIILAAELTRRYSKDEILEIYLNNNNYGNLAYGVDAAARTYFGTNAANLNLAQAAFLAGLPQLPSIYDPFHGGRDAALKRHKVVLDLMTEDRYITAEDAAAAAAEMDAYEFKPIFTDRIPAPHFITYVKQEVEATLGPDKLYTGSGLRIYTTLDWKLQSIAEEEVANGVAALAGANVSNGALVAIEPSSGHILAMVGSVDFYNNDNGGQVNVTLRCRQPGSAIKPLTFLAAFERGWTPATIVWDVPTVYTDAWGNRYEPVNYDGQFRGPTSIRTALANSLNLPAVKALEFVTVDGLLQMSEKLGATSIVSPQLECPDYPGDTRPYYGLALTLGGGELKPLELTSAYATIANGGLRLAPTPILWIEDRNGNVLVDNRQRQSEQVVRPELAYLLTHILSDTKARCLVFACPNNLELPDRPVAAKTGTTNDNRDAWTVGYTPDIAAGVWVGNNDNTPMSGVAGAGGAGPIWNGFMRRAHESRPARAFPRPASVIEREVCALSGTEPSSYCPEKRTEVFAVNVLPPRAELDWFREVEIDANSNLLANEYCRSNIVAKVMVDLSQISDPGGRAWMQAWAAQRGVEIAPTEYCTKGSGDTPQLRIITPPNGAEVTAGLLDIHGTVEMPDFDRYELYYGIGQNPGGWGWISGPHLAMVREGLLGSWLISQEMQPGVYTLRILAYNQRGAQFEVRSLITLVAPTPTPTASPTLTPEPSLTPTPSPTVTPEPPTVTPELPTVTPEPPTVTPELPTVTPELPTVTPEPPTPEVETPVPHPTLEESPTPGP